MIGIYCITNNVNGKKYIGQSVNVERRISEHKSLTRQNAHDTPLYKAFAKYGIDNFDFVCLVTCQEQDLDELEKFYIKKYRTFEKQFGYNLTIGGKGYSGNFTKKHKENISKGKTGKKIKSPSKATLEKRSASLRKVKHTVEWHKKIGEKHKGKKISDDVKDKISSSLKTYYANNPVSQETRNKIAEKSKSRKMGSEARMKISKAVSKPVLQISIDGVLLKEYKNAREATKNTNVGFTSISSCCNGKRNTAGGFIWKHKELTK